ncbi:MAG TPA: ABC transporter permease [Candidatus Hydrogenedentes bacterium]|nr:ABC transporter permease [Candidatus Hydrogenedentota bacterium]HPG66582.1 ABC transporter permease [Candidatus Hydrogenedentota bacterium]
MREVRVTAPERLDQQSGREVFDALNQTGLEQGDDLTLDLSDTRSIDPRGGAWIVELAQRAYAKRGSFRCTGQTGRVAEFVDLIEPALVAPPKRARQREGLVEEIGGRALMVLGEVGEFLKLLVDAIYWTLIGPLEGRGFRWGLLVDEIHEMGVRAVRIILLMNFLLGLIIAMLSAAQVAPLGLGIYVANLIIIGFARELAAIMTATVVSARTGAAIAAELATMKVQEEIDALRGMGLNVTQFLVAPKVVALVLVMPCLVALGMVSGILGGAVWGIGILGYRGDVWFKQTLNAADLGDFFQGMLKTLFFAVMIVLVGCHNGLRVTGGSRGVGLMTTRAVVMDIFFLIVIDMIFATVFYYVLD